MALSDGNLKYVTNFDNDKDWIHFEKDFRYGYFYIRICGQVFCIKNDQGELKMSTIQPGQILESALNTRYDIAVENAEFNRLQKRLSLIGISDGVYRWSKNLYICKRVGQRESTCRKCRF